MNPLHEPVMVAEVLEHLDPSRGGVFVDCTVGLGGHARALLQGGASRLIGLDRDPAAIDRARVELNDFRDRVDLVHADFRRVSALLDDRGVTSVSGVLADLGVSSMQLDDPSRGFTFKREGPLDLRMNPNRGQPASSLLGSLDAARLARMLETNADQPDAGPLAEALVERQRLAPIETTTALAAAVRDALGDGPDRRNKDEHLDVTLRRVFQALRIEVNDEFGALDTFLRHLPACVKSGGRIAILTFHSGEDRRVKQAFKAGAAAGIYDRIADEVIRASPEERRANPRATPAKLRWAVRS